MPNVVTLSASIRSPDLAHLADRVKLVEPDADVFQDDIMDARSVPSLAFGPVVVAALRPHTDRTPHDHLQAPDVAAAAAGRGA
jgi:ribulose-phosphate 3-epimerase